MAADACKPLFDCGRGILRQIDQHAARAGNIEGAQARCAAGDGKCEIEPEPAFAAFGRPPDDSDSGAGSERINQPGMRFEGFF